MTLQGPLEQMDEVELQHWMHVAAIRTIAMAQQALHLLLDGSATRVAIVSTPLQVCMLLARQGCPDICKMAAMLLRLQWKSMPA